MSDSIAHLLRWAKAALATESAALDAEILLAFVLDKNRSYLYTWPEKRLSDADIQTFKQLMAQRQLGVPVAYLLGTQEFWSLPLQVTSATLIPRPETEELITAVLQQHQGHEKLNVLDAGTGSGAIAIVLAKEKPHWDIFACDFSMPALRVAQRNAIDHSTDINFINSNWLACVQANSLDIIVSNPPYIAEGDHHLAALKYEPTSALVAAHHGLADICEIVAQASNALRPKGSLYIEHGYDQASRVQAIFAEHQFISVKTEKDYAGCDRFTYGEKS